MSVVAWAQEIASRSDVVYLDTETTGLGPTAEIVDLAIVGADGAALFDVLVRPSCPIDPAATAVHGLADDDLRDAPTWPEIADEACALLAGRQVIVYNAAYDSRVLAHCCQLAGRTLPSATWHCAMHAFAAFVGQPDARGRGFRWHSLDRAAASFGVPPGGHRALGDARACRSVVLGMAGTG